MLQRWIVGVLMLMSFSRSDSFGQAAPRIQWQRCLGGSLAENPSPLNSHTIIQTVDSGYVLVAETGSKNGDVVGNHGLTDDIWVVKLSQQGEVMWSRCLGSNFEESPGCIIQTTDGGFAVAGFTGGDGGDVSHFHGGHTDEWVVKLDSVGSIVWQTCLGGGGDESATSIIQTSDGGFAVAGYTSSTGEGWDNHGWDDAFVVKLSAIGNTEWQRLYGGASADEANSILQTADGGFVFAGWTNSLNTGDVSGKHGSFGNPLADAWVVRLDRLGNLVWQKCFGGSDDDYASMIIHTDDGGYSVVGTTSSVDGDVVGNPGSTDMWVFSIDTAGTLMWQQCLGGLKGGNVSGSGIIQTLGGGFVCVGTTASNDGDVSGLHGSGDSSDGWIVGLSPTGRLLWQKCLGGTELDEAFSVIQSKDRGFVVYGRTMSNNGDVSGNHGNIDAWVAKLGAPSDGIDLASSEPSYLNPYPNPAEKELKLELYRSAPIRQVQFFNSLGAQCFPDYHMEGTTLMVDLSSLLSGMYVVRVAYRSDGHPIGDQIRTFLHSSE